MFISKEITTGQAAVLAQFFRSVPSEFYVEHGMLCCEQEQKSKRARLLSALSRNLGIGDGPKLDDDVETAITSTALPDMPVALWRVARLADRKIGNQQSPIIRDARGVMASEDIRISKDGIWVFGALVTTWGPGKNYLEKFEVDSVAAAMVARNELFAVQVFNMIERGVMAKADLSTDSPAIMVNPHFIEWLRQWVPGGYSMLKAALTLPHASNRVAVVQEIVDAAPGHAFNDTEDFAPADTLNHVSTLVAATNYAPFTLDDEGWLDFTKGDANEDVAEMATCDCGNCDPTVVTTHGYRGQVTVVSELGAFSTMPKTPAELTKSIDRLAVFLSENRQTAYDVVAEGITDDMIPGWTELHIKATAECSTVQ